jgi:uncharacterized Rmd1/YagE family protein
MSTSSANTSDGKVNVVILGRILDEALVSEQLIQKEGAVKYRDAYLLKTQEGEAWLFEYGILVFWNIKEHERQQLITKIHPIVIDKIVFFRR